MQVINIIIIKILEIILCLYGFYYLYHSVDNIPIFRHMERKHQK